MSSLSGWLTDIRMGYRNVGRNPVRTMLACLAIAIAQVTLIWVNSFMNGHEAKIFETLTGAMLGHIQVHALKYRDDEAIERVIPKASSLAGRIAEVPHVQGVSQRVYAPVLASLKEAGHVARLTGVSIQAERKAGGILEGLGPDRAPAGQEVLIGKGLAADMGVRQGDTLALMGQAMDGSIASGLYRVKAVIETPVDQINQVGIIMDLPVSQEFLDMGDQIHEIVIRTDGQQSVPGVLSSLKALPPLKPYEILSWDQIVPAMATLLQMAGKVNYLIMAMVFLTTIAGIVNTMLMATFERVHEFGMLLALGCNPGRLIRLLAIESLLLGIAGVAIGTAIGVGLTLYGVRNGIDLGALGGAGHGSNYTFEGMSISMKVFPILKLQDVAGGIGSVCVTSVLASLWPARRISRLEPVEAMRT
ncbi:MAG: FtsX-like permease family protein [Oryzomonas sp.]|jgi:ABC-type lipoprotein release transport system permease subunit